MIQRLALRIGIPVHLRAVLLAAVFAGEAVATSPLDTRPLSGTPGLVMLHPGSNVDLGEQVREALDASHDHCAKITLAPGNYTYMETIHLWLPCQSLIGSGITLTSLNFAGRGDAIVWQMHPFTTRAAGQVADFTLVGNPSADVGLRSGTLVLGKLANLSIELFKTGILFENLRTQLDGQLGGKDGQAWTERMTLNSVALEINDINLDMEVHGGTGSFGYETFGGIYMDTTKQQIAFRLGPMGYIYNSTLHMHVNGSGTGDVYQIAGFIENSDVHLDGETTCKALGLHVLAGGRIHSDGSVIVNCPRQPSDAVLGRFRDDDLASTKVDDLGPDALRLGPQYNQGMQTLSGTPSKAMMRFVQRVQLGAGGKVSVPVAGLDEKAHCFAQQVGDSRPEPVAMQSGNGILTVHGAAGARGQYDVFCDHQ